MGPLENVLGMLPGMDKLKDSSIDERQLKRVEAIVLSMTPEGTGASRYPERATTPEGGSRKRLDRNEVNNLLLRFNQMRKMMKKADK